MIPSIGQLSITETIVSIHHNKLEIAFSYTIFSTEKFIDSIFSERKEPKNKMHLLYAPDEGQHMEGTAYLKTDKMTVQKMKGSKKTGREPATGPRTWKQAYPRSPKGGRQTEWGKKDNGP